MQSTGRVVDCLTAEGYRITRTYLQWVLRDRHIPMPVKSAAGTLEWSPADVDRLRSFLCRHARGPGSAGL